MQDEELFTEQRQCAPDGAGCAAKLGPIVGVIDREPKTPAIADRLLDHFTQMTHADHHSRDPIFLEQAQLVGEERLAIYIDQSLGKPRG